MSVVYVTWYVLVILKVCFALCFMQMDKEDDNEPAIPKGQSSPGIKGNGVSFTVDAADGRKGAANSVDAKSKPGTVVPEQQPTAAAETRPKSRHSSGERKTRHWSGDRWSRLSAKEKEPTVPKSERLYRELIDAVANDNVPRTRSVMRHNSLTPEGRLRGLHAAVQRGSNKAAKAILDVEPALVHRADPDSGNTAFLVAIEAATVSTMSLLVDRGARLDVKNSSGETVWDTARRVPHDNKGLIPTLIGLYRQHSHDYRTTPIHEAAAAGDLDKIEFLVEAGLELWDPDHGGYNFIHIAAFNNRTNVIDRYLHHSAVLAEAAPSEPDVDRRSASNGKTALHIAANRGHLESFLALLKCGANLNARDNGGWTSLHDAVVCRNEPAAVRIIRAIYDHSRSLLSAVTNDKETPLHVAARHGKLKAVMVLLELSANGSLEALSSQDIDGWTPLHSAVESRRPEVVQLILEGAATAESDATHTLLGVADKSGATPLRLAQSLSDADEVVKILQSH